MNKVNEKNKKEFQRNKETINIKEFMLLKSGEQDKLIEEMINKCGWNCNGKQTGSHKKLNKFFQFKTGDTVIIPDTKSFHIVKIVEDIK